MAERSFAKEIQSLKLGDGDNFEGEGILAVAKAALQAGVSYVGGYPGSPVSQLIDVLSEARDIRDEYGIHLEICTSEASAAAMLGASNNYPARGLVVWKSVAGSNVASDALTYLSSPGVTGGTVIVIGEDYGEGAAAVQERSHAFALKSSIWLLDPRPDLTTIVDTVEKAFDLSEYSHSPVMVMLRIFACHVQGSFTARDNTKPAFSRHNKFSHSIRDYDRIPGGPSLFVQEKAKVEERLPAAKKFIMDHAMNETFEGDLKQIGIITQGGLYNSLMRALERLGLADAYGATRVPVHVLNVTHPLVDEQLAEFCSHKQRVLMVEEGHPEYIEQALNAILRKADVNATIHGKDVLPLVGQYTPEELLAGLARFMELASISTVDTSAPEVALNLQSMADQHLVETIPPRPPTFCTGCPERPIFSAIKLVEEKLGTTYISCDIGCLTYSTLPPFNLSNSLSSYGLGLASSSAMAPMFDKRVISIMGDGGFWHNGLSSGVANAVFNEDDSILIIVNNGYISATGWQPLPSSPKNGSFKDSQMSIQRTLQGVGVKWLHTVRTYDVAKMMRTLSEAVTTTTKGLKVIVAESECMLAKQRRVRAQRSERLKKGQRDVRPRFGIDDDVCTGDHSCIRLSGCPSLTIKQSSDVLRTDPIAHVNNDCVGCGLCGELAHAAVLCPSFYKAQIISNPSLYERLLGKVRTWVIDRLATPEPLKV